MASFQDLSSQPLNATRHSSGVIFSRRVAAAAGWREAAAAAGNRAIALRGSCSTTTSARRPTRCAAALPCPACSEDHPVEREVRHSAVATDLRANSRAICSSVYARRFRWTTVAPRAAKPALRGLGSLWGLAVGRDHRPAVSPAPPAARWCGLWCGLWWCGLWWSVGLVAVRVVVVCGGRRSLVFYVVVSGSLWLRMAGGWAMYEAGPGLFLVCCPCPRRGVHAPPAYIPGQGTVFS